MNRPPRNLSCRPPFAASSADGGLSRLLSDFVGQTASTARQYAQPTTSQPGLTAWETDLAYEIELDLPGLAREALQIELLDGVLTISGVWPREELPEGARLLRNERPQGDFSRTVRFASEVETDQVRAEFTDGVLRVTLPKRPEARPRRIEIAGERAPEIDRGDDNQ